MLQQPFDGYTYDCVEFVTILVVYMGFFYWIWRLMYCLHSWGCSWNCYSTLPNASTGKRNVNESNCINFCMDSWSWTPREIGPKYGFGKICRYTGKSLYWNNRGWLHDQGFGNLCQRSIKCTTWGLLRHICVHWQAGRKIKRENFCIIFFIV